MKENEDEKKGKKEYKDRVFPVFGHFPLSKWIEYETEVEDVWAGCRWAKAWHDHEIAKGASKEEAMWNAILDMKKDLELVKAQEQGDLENEVVKTLGMGKEDDEK